MKGNSQGDQTKMERPLLLSPIGCLFNNELSHCKEGFAYQIKFLAYFYGSFGVLVTIYCRTKAYFSLPHLLI